MFLKFFFNHLSDKKQVDYLKKRGILLGTRNKDDRTIYTYMLTNLFVEVMYKNDNVDDQPEMIKTLSGLRNLNDYLEKEFRASF